MLLEIPLKTVSLLNQREAWQVTANRKKLHRAVVGRHLDGFPQPTLPCVVMLTRVAPGTLDAHDNLPSSFKHVVDALAVFMGVDDSDSRVVWRYEQKKAPRGCYSITVDFVES